MPGAIGAAASAGLGAPVELVAAGCQQALAFQAEVARSTRHIELQLAAACIARQPLELRRTQAGVKFQALRVVLPAALPTGVECGIAGDPTGIQRTRHGGPARQPARGLGGILHLHRQCPFACCTGQLTVQCSVQARQAQVELSLGCLVCCVVAQLALHMGVGCLQAQRVEGQQGGRPEPLRHHALQLQAEPPVTCWRGSRIWQFGACGLQLDVKPDAFGALVGTERAADLHAGQGRKQASGVEGADLGLALPALRAACTWGWLPLPLCHHATPGNVGLKRLQLPLPLAKFQFGQQRLHRQALLVQRPAQAVAQLHAGLPAGAGRAYRCLATEQGLRCLGPQRGQVQRLPLAMGCHDRL